MTIFVSAIISGAIVLSSLFMAGWRVDFDFGHPLGALTDISQSTRITDFVDIYNTNNDQTVEVGTTSVDTITTLSNLVTTGVISSSTWNGTVIDQIFGGTGSTTRLRGVLWGDGTSESLLGIATGTSGQILTSNGYGAMPSFQDSSINLNQDYTWLGVHSFSGGQPIFNASTTFGGGATTTFFGGIVASSTTQIEFGNGETAYFPNSINASGTALMLGNNGQLVFGPVQEILYSSTTRGVFAGTGAVDILNIQIPGGTIQKSTRLVVEVYNSTNTTFGATSGDIVVNFIYGGTTFGNPSIINTSGGNLGGDGLIKFVLTATSSATSQFGLGHWEIDTSDVSAAGGASDSGAALVHGEIATGSDQTLQVQYDGAAAADSLETYYVVVYVER